MLENYFQCIIQQRDLGESWGVLPDYIRNDPLMKRYKECVKHKPTCDQIDGPSPRIIDCPSCKEEDKNAIK